MVNNSCVLSVFICCTDCCSCAGYADDVDMVKGEVGHMEEFLVKRQVLLSPDKAAEMILRVDDIIRAQPRSPGRCAEAID